MEQFVFLGEAARMARVSEKTLRAWVDKGLVKAERATSNNMRVIDRASLVDFLASRNAQKGEHRD